jgi:hypothetical protein
VLGYQDLDLAATDLQQLAAERDLLVRALRFVNVGFGLWLVATPCCDGAPLAAASAASLRDSCS